MLKSLNEQVQKHQEIADELVSEIAEIDAELEWLSDTVHPDFGRTGFPNVVISLRLIKRKSRLVKSLEERQRVLEGKLKRREQWLAGKRPVATERAKKVRERLLSLSDVERAEIGFTGLGLDGLKELSASAERKYKALVAVKELAVMLEEVFDGEDELEEAEEGLAEVVMRSFEA